MSNASRLSEQERKALTAILARRRTPVEVVRRAAVKNDDREDFPESPGHAANSSWQVHLHKIALVISYLFLSNRIFLGLLGVLNRNVIHTVFLAYPSSREFLNGYSYFSSHRLGAWRASLIGVFQQGNSWGLTFAITSTEAQIQEPANADRLMQVYGQMQRIMRTVGARELRLAGVIPGMLFARGVPISKAEGEASVTAIMNADARVRALEQIDESAPVIVLGADGFIGQQLLSRLSSRNIYPVDIGPGGLDVPNLHAWPHYLRDRKTLLINVARSGTLELYSELLWDSLVVLNEVYPTPPARVLRRLQSLRCRCYHIAGARGNSYPPFPAPYAGAIPCCASKIEGNTEILVTRVV
jgi:hypothetical protein